MKRKRIPLALSTVTLLAVLGQIPLPAATETIEMTYPKAPRVEQVDDYHGVKVEDPFRTLENSDTKDTRSWIEKENELTFSYLDKIKVRKSIKKRLTYLWDYEKYTVPFERAGKLFYFKNTGLQNQNVLYVKETADAEPRLLLDPNKLSEDGTVALSSLNVSEDGKYLAYGISKSGSDWQEWFVKEVASGKQLDDHLEWIKFSDVSWRKDGDGFFYSRYDKPDEKTKFEKANYFQKLYYHRLGDKQEKDVLVYERKDHKTWGFSPEVTEDGKYLVISVWEGTAPENRVFYKRLDAEGDKAEVIELLPDANARYTFAGNQGATFWFNTDLEAPRGRLIAIDTESSKPGQAKIEELVPQCQDTLESISAVGGRFFLSYLKDAYTRVEERSLDGQELGKIELPGIGTASGFGGELKDKTTYYSYTSFNTPPIIYRFDIEKQKSTTLFKPDLKFDPDRFVTEQVFVESKDGTKVPLFITHKRGVKPSPDTPTYLYGYGGFNIALRPSFSVTMLTWMEMGGIYAQACLRGGGEYGKKWHKAGTRAHKQNVFDDFIACGEWLVKNKYTSTPKLAIAGGSNGGLLVGACLTQRPDLFGAACPSVGVMDMLRFHKFTIGWAWTSDYGSADNAEEFKSLYKYSPLHNIKDGTDYPATFITTADHDDRVVPLHSFKFAARLQEAQKGKAPVLIRIETKAGHGAGKPTTKIIEESSDRLAFLSRALGFEEQATLALEDSGESSN